MPFLVRRKTIAIFIGEEIMRKQSSLVLAMVTIVSLGGVCKAVPVEWSVDDGGNGHFYEAVVVTAGINWAYANAAAVTAGRYLATITSAEENAFVYALVSSDSSFWTVGLGGESVGPWLGGFQPGGSPEPDGNWQWVTGELFAYTNWAQYEPNNYRGIEHYLSFYNATPNSMAPTWNDIPDYDPPYSPVGYVVEIPEPATLLLLGLCSLMLRKKQ